MCLFTGGVGMSPVMTTRCHYHGDGYVQGVGMSREGVGISRDGYVQGRGWVCSRGWVSQKRYIQRGCVVQREGWACSEGERDGYPPLDIGPAGGGYPARPRTWDFGCATLLLTLYGSHQNMYSWQADSMHPTGILSCLEMWSSYTQWHLISHLLTAHGTNKGGNCK